jgi:REP element-mobilizing transposase RayT
MSQDKAFYRRKLPHWSREGTNIFVTWRLHGSLPVEAVQRLEERRKLVSREKIEAELTTSERRVRQAKKAFAQVDRILDKAESGPLWLRQTPIAQLFVDALLTRYQDLYALWSYVVMANHVHILLQPRGTTSSDDQSQLSFVPLKVITKSLKGYTAKEANRVLGRTGQPFWQIESLDHWARDQFELHRIVNYIENNPVKAGLALSPQDWRWSFAWERCNRGWSEVRALT